MKITDEAIMDLWRATQPSKKQTDAMTYDTGPCDITVPTVQLRSLVELSMTYKLTPSTPPEKCPFCGGIGNDHSPNHCPSYEHKPAATVDAQCNDCEWKQLHDQGKGWCYMFEDKIENCTQRKVAAPAVRGWQENMEFDYLQMVKRIERLERQVAKGGEG